MDIRINTNEYWQVDASQGGFTARRLDSAGRVSPLHNFEEGADWMRVGGWYMGYDLSGKSKEVLTRERFGESTQWQKEGSRFGMRLRVRSGPLKGWWVGLGPREPAKSGRPPTARLVLVEDKKNAAVFAWEDPNDVSP